MIMYGMVVGASSAEICMHGHMFMDACMEAISAHDITKPMNPCQISCQMTVNVKTMLM